MKANVTHETAAAEAVTLNRQIEMESLSAASPDVASNSGNVYEEYIPGNDEDVQGSNLLFTCLPEEKDLNDEDDSCSNKTQEACGLDVCVEDMMVDNTIYESF